MRELGSIYEETRQRILDVVAGLDGTAASPRVPACPEWSIQDLLAHLAGNCTDILEGNVEGAASPEWTARQVERRRGWTFSEVLAEWDRAGPQAAGLLDDFPGRYGEMLIADVTSHEHDVRGALARPGARDSRAMGVAIDFLVNVFLHTGANSLGVGPLEVRAGGRTWVVGGGPVDDDPDAWRNALMTENGSPEAEPKATVAADTFELARAIAGRRSAPQVRDLGWSVDPEPYLPMFGIGPFELRDADLEE